jgi:hypothetical protein
MLDLYGAEFGLNYRGKEKYQTCLGSMFTLLVVVVVGIFTVKNFYKMAYRIDPEVYTITD